MRTKKTEHKLYSAPMDEVHIWAASLLDHNKDIDYLKSTLSQDEQQRTSHFKFSKDQNNYIITRGILRCLLSTYLEKPPQSVEFVYGLWGKPCLLEKKVPLHFSVSHSGNYALYAFICQYEVGIDIEYIDKDFEIEDILPTILSPTEQNLWYSVPLEERLQTFFSLWTCKEAYLKAFGKGWLENKTPLSLVNIALSGKNSKAYPPSNSVTAYPYTFGCIPGYACALFVKGPSLPVIYRVYEAVHKKITSIKCI